MSSPTEVPSIDSWTIQQLLDAYNTKREEVRRQIGVIKQLVERHNIDESKKALTATTKKMKALELAIIQRINSERSSSS